MIFWIVTALIVLGWLAWTVCWWIDDWVFGVMIFFLGGLLAAGVWFLLAVCLIASAGSHLVGASRIESSTSQLKSLGSDSSVEGRMFFLGGGYIDGKRVLSFIRENENGSFTPDQVDGEASQVFESDADAPAMVTHEHVADHWWLAPATTLHRTYEFTVPVGSVSDDFSVKP